MDNEFTELEILRARAAQYGIGIFSCQYGYSVVCCGERVGTWLHTELEALNAAIRLGELARRLNAPVEPFVGRVGDEIIGDQNEGKG